MIFDHRIDFSTCYIFVTTCNERIALIFIESFQLIDLFLLKKSYFFVCFNYEILILHRITSYIPLTVCIETTDKLYTSLIT